MKYVLFNARHRVPPDVVGALCADYEFKTNAIIHGPAWEAAIEDTSCEIYVTGLTQALTGFIFEWLQYWQQKKYDCLDLGYWIDHGGATLTLWHWDRRKETYHAQTMTL